MKSGKKSYRMNVLMPYKYVSEDRTHVTFLIIKYQIELF